MKLNYLNNKDILKEIHKSKITFCSFPNAEDSEYDIIVSDLKKINKKMIKAGKEARAARLAKLAQEAAMATGDKRKLEEFEIKPSKIPQTDVVFRVMTWDHIPIDDIKQRKQEEAWEEKETEYDEDGLEIKMPNKYVKVNFPPFQHYKVDENGVPYCVGKSHWQGPLDTGKFCRDHGKMTNKLASMFIKLCERYGTRSNWRSYTYNDEMRSQALLQLSQIGLQFDESKSSNPFAYYTAAITNSFTRVLNIEKRHQNIRDDILELNNYNPSYTRQNMFGGNSGSDE